MARPLRAVNRKSGRPSAADPAAEDKVHALLRLRAAGREAYPAFPVLGINHRIGAKSREESLVSNLPLVTTVLCRQGGEWISYEADRHGFNNPVVEWDEGRPGDDMTVVALALRTHDETTLVRRQSAKVPLP